MCGITGFTWTDKELVTKAIQKIKYRGPEKVAGYVDHGVSLGHARLKILDLTKAADQPMIIDDAVIVYNGEIYNYQEIRGELERLGHRFETTGDTEVLLKAWRQWGTACLDKLNGMFAFAVVEPDKKTLTLVRDRFGIKPLYYAVHRDRETKRNSLVFGSEIRAIRVVHDEIGIEPKVSEDALKDFLTLRHTQNNTLFSGIKKIPPGNMMVFDLTTTKFTTETWYKLPMPEFVNTAFALKRLPELLRSSVKYRMIADVPVGFFLSGGIDSGIITTLAAEEKKRLGEASDSIRTFSVGFEEDHELSEAKFMANHLGTNHTELIVKESDANIVDTVVRHTGEPIGDAALIPTYLISQKAKEDVTCVQAGEGADEIFGGYDRYKFVKYGKYASKIAQIMPNASKNDIYKRVLELKGKDDYDIMLHASRLFDKQEIGGPEIDNNKYKELFKGNSLMQKVSRFDIQTVLVNDFFMKADSMPMAHALEERVPFMDHRVVELGLATQDNAKIKLATGKWILRNSFKQIPTEVKKRRKRGYNVPVDVWFDKNGLLREQLSAYLDEAKHRHYSVEKAKKLLESYSPENNITLNFRTIQKLFSILSFETWLRMNFQN